MKRSIESSTYSYKKQKKPFRISKCVMQNKIQNGKPYGEDIKPIVAYTDDACVVIVADGHGGAMPLNAFWNINMRSSKTRSNQPNKVCTGRSAYVKTPKAVP